MIPPPPLSPLSTCPFRFTFNSPSPCVIAYSSLLRQQAKQAEDDAIAAKSNEVAAKAAEKAVDKAVAKAATAAKEEAIAESDQPLGCFDSRRRGDLGWVSSGKAHTRAAARALCKGSKYLSLECPTKNKVDGVVESEVFCLKTESAKTGAPKLEDFAECQGKPASKDMNGGTNGHCVGPFTLSDGTDAGGWHRGVVFAVDPAKGEVEAQAALVAQASKAQSDGKAAVASSTAETKGAAGAAKAEKAALATADADADAAKREAIEETSVAKPATVAAVETKKSAETQAEAQLDASAAQTMLDLQLAKCKHTQDDQLTCHAQGGGCGMVPAQIDAAYEECVAKANKANQDSLSQAMPSRGSKPASCKDYVTPASASAVKANVWSDEECKRKIYTPEQWTDHLGSKLCKDAPAKNFCATTCYIACR